MNEKLEESDFAATMAITLRRIHTCAVDHLHRNDAHRQSKEAAAISSRMLEPLNDELLPS